MVSHEARKKKNITVVAAGNFFINGGFSPNDAPTHLRVTAANSKAFTQLQKLNCKAYVTDPNKTAQNVLRSPDPIF